MFANFPKETSSGYLQYSLLKSSGHCCWCGWTSSTTWIQSFLWSYLGKIALHDQVASFPVPDVWGFKNHSNFLISSAASVTGFYLFCGWERHGSVVQQYETISGIQSTSIEWFGFSFIQNAMWKLEVLKSTNRAPVIFTWTHSNWSQQVSKSSNNYWET